MQVFLDVESVPGQSPEAREAASASIKPPGTLKKPESIASWWENEAPGAEREAWRKQALDGGSWGELVSIAACTDDQQWVHCRAQGESEADLLREFFATVERWSREEAERANNSPHYWPGEVYVVGHNSPFDIGFLWRRCIVLGVPMPQWLPGPTSHVGRNYGCTMQLWAGYGQRVSLGTLCTVLGLASPKSDGMDGGQVFDAWQAGEYERIAAYNLRDALAVRQIWQRLQGRGV